MIIAALRANGLSHDEIVTVLTDTGNEQDQNAASQIVAAIGRANFSPNAIREVFARTGLGSDTGSSWLPTGWF